MAAPQSDSRCLDSYSPVLSTTPTSDNWSQVISGLKDQKYKLTHNEETHANSKANELKDRKGSTPEGCSHGAREEP